MDANIDAIRQQLAADLLRHVAGDAGWLHWVEVANAANVAAAVIYPAGNDKKTEDQ